LEERRKKREDKKFSLLPSLFGGGKKKEKRRRRGGKRKGWLSSFLSGEGGEKGKEGVIKGKKRKEGSVFPLRVREGEIKGKMAYAGEGARETLSDNPLCLRRKGGRQIPIEGVGGKKGEHGVCSYPSSMMERKGKGHEDR